MLNWARVKILQGAKSCSVNINFEAIPTLGVIWLSNIEIGTAATRLTAIGISQNEIRPAAIPATKHMPMMVSVA